MERKPKDLKGLMAQYPYFTLWMIYATTCGFTVLPLLISIVVLIRPCTPPFPGYFLPCDYTQSRHLPSYIILTISSSFFSLFIHINLFASAVIGFVYGSTLLVYALFLNLRSLGNRNSPKWKVASAAATDLFERELLTYRKLQILFVLYNECFQWMCFTFFMFFTYFLTSVYLYAFVKFHCRISLPGSMFLLLISVTGFLGIFVLNSISGKVYHLSNKLPYKWLSITQSFKQTALIRKKIRSCSGVKIRVGSVNFVDRLTPFVVCGLCLKISTRLLMST
jgi:hypothetical protein